MNFKNANHVKHHNLKLTNEEIKTLEEFANISGDEADALADFIYNISIILYKSNKSHE